jgi:hypothetical protein
LAARESYYWPQLGNWRIEPSGKRTKEGDVEIEGGGEETRRELMLIMGNEETWIFTL